MKSLLRAMFLLVLLGLFSFASLGTALAQVPSGTSSPPAKRVNLTGQIKSIDHGAKSFVLKVMDRFDVTIKTNADTKFQVPDDKNGKLNDLDVGDRVTVTVVETADGDLALVVRLLPTYMSGQIKSIDQAAKSFVLIVKDKGDVTIKTNADTKIKLYGNADGTFNDLKAGDRVTVTLWETKDGNLALVVTLLPTSFSGQIKSIDQGAKSFVVTVKDRGDITVNTNADTKIKLYGDKDGAFSDLKAGQGVAVTMVQTADGNLALVVRLLPVYISGPIKSIDQGAKSLVVTVKDRGDVAVNTNADTKIKLYGDKDGTFNDLKAGNRVAVTMVETTDGNLALVVRLLPVYISGPIKSIDQGAKSFVLTVKDKGDVTIKTNADTKFQVPDEKNAKLNDLDEGDRVTVTMVETADGNVALVVTLLPVSLSGQIKSIDQGSKSFVLIVKDKGDVTIKTNADTKIKLYGNADGTLNDLKAGNRVTVTLWETKGDNLALVVRLLPVSLSGQIKSIDQAAKSFVLTVKDKGDVAIKTNADTKIKLYGDKDGTLTDLKAGDPVTVAMVETADGNLALVVRLLPVYISGPIKSIDQGAKSLVVTVKDKGDVAIKTNADTKIKLYGDKDGTLNDLKAGDPVTVAMAQTADGNLALVVRLLPVYMSGQIKSIDQGSKSFVLTVKDKGDVTIKTNADTKFQVPDEKNGKLNDLDVGDRVTVAVVQIAEGNLALLVRLLPTSLTGQIKSIDQGAKSFVLTVKDKGDVAIKTNADTKIKLYGDKDGTLNDIKVGDRVTVTLWETKDDNLALVVRLLPVYISGPIKSIDQGAKSLVVTVKDKGDVAIKTNADTKIKLYGDKDGTFNDLKVGNPVAVTMVETADGNLALVVRLLPVSLSGQIKSIDSGAKTFVFTVKNRGDVAIKTNADTKVKLYGGKDGTFNNLEVGDLVTVAMAETADGNLALMVRLLVAQ